MSLSVREKIKESVKKGGLSNDELHHPSRAYERHFEGYVETAQEVPGQNRSRSVRTYVDSYWRQELSAKRRTAYQVLFVLLFLLALPPFLYGASRPITANTVWFVTLPQALSLFALGWTALGLLRYCTVPQTMTVRQHRLAVLHFHRACCAAWITPALLTLAYLIFALLHTDERTTTLVCALLSLFSSLCLAAVYWVEHSTGYTELENPLARK